MSVEVAAEIHDQTLYRALPFLIRGAFEGEAGHQRRLKALDTALEQLRWKPPVASLLTLPPIEYRQQRLWNDWIAVDPAGAPVAGVAPIAASDWSIHLYAQSYHEVVLVLIGVEQAGGRPWPAWLEQAEAGWERRWGGEASWRGVIAPPGADLHASGTAEPPGQARLLGQSWIWTGEWRNPPTEGWEAFGEATYGPRHYAVFPWGLLGYDAPNDGAALPRFDLHTTLALKEQRGWFLFSDLPVILAEFVKATQFLWAGYERGWSADLNELARQVDEAAQHALRESGAISLRQREDRVVSLAGRLADLGDRLRDLEGHGWSAAIARDEVARRLAAEPAGPAGGLPATLLMEIERVARQIQSDARYFQAAEARGRLALESQRTLAAIAQTRAEQVQTEVEIKVAAFLGVIGTLVALGHILEPAMRETWHDLPPLLIAAVAALIALAVGVALGNWVNAWLSGQLSAED